VKLLFDNSEVTGPFRQETDAVIKLLLEKGLISAAEDIFDYLLTPWMSFVKKELLQRGATGDIATATPEFAICIPTHWSVTSRTF
jgi:hypothetical protein